MALDHAYEGKQPFYGRPFNTAKERPSMRSRQKERFKQDSQVGTEDVRIHYGSANSSDAQPVQFLKPLGFMSYTRSPDVKEALREYHVFCDSVPENDLLDQHILEGLINRLNRVQEVCGEDNPLHRNLRAQADLEQSICVWLQRFLTRADDMANLIEGLNGEQQEYIRRLYYASKIVENREDMPTSEIYKADNFSFIDI